MAHNKKFNLNDEKKYDPEATKELRKVLLTDWSSVDKEDISRLIKSIKKEIRRGADPRLLLEKITGARLYQTLFELVACAGEADFIQELFDKGLEPTYSVLICAIHGRYSGYDRYHHGTDIASIIKTVNTILNKNPDLIHSYDKDGVTPLINSIMDEPYLTNSIRDEQYNLIETLLKRGANPNMQEDRGLTALMLAEEAGRPNIVNLLLEYGANDELQNRWGQVARNYFNNSNTSSNYSNYSNYSNNSNNQNGGGRKTRRGKRSKRVTRRGKTRSGRRRH